jgi:hypothetical protein
MNYQRTKQPSKYATKIVIAVAILLVLLRLIVPHAFAAFFAEVFSPFWRLENAIVRSVVPSNQIVFSSDSSFASSTIADLLQENNDLKNMLGRSTALTAQNSIVVAVLSKPPFSAYDSLIVDAGSDLGAQVGDKVYALANPVVYSTSADLPPSASTTVALPFVSASVSASTSSKTATASASSTVPSDVSANPQIEIPIGQVALTLGDTSVITLFSSPGQKYTVEIGSYHISATAVAVGGGMFEAMVPNNSNIAIGDPVIVPSIQTGVFASVVSVVSDPARPYSLVLFQSPVNPFSLYFVEIEKASDVAAKTK